MKNILVAGGTGLIGQRLCQLLSQEGFRVAVVSRRENLTAPIPAYGWDLNKMTINPAAIEYADAIINLTGAGVADKRWTAKRKKEIIDSRVLSNQLLAQAIEKSAKKPAVFVACSAVGYYGNQGNKIQTENSDVGQDFMAEVCRLWEESVIPIREMGIRTPIIRVGVVLSTQGGALVELNKTAPLRTIGYFGMGNRYVSWIHMDDICQIFIAAIKNEKMTAVYNGTAPSPVTSKEMANALVESSGKFMIQTPVPPLALRLALGEMADVVLNSTRATPQNLNYLKFEFKHPDLVEAIKDLYARNI